MQTRTSAKKSDLQAKIESLYANFDTDTDAIDGETYTHLYEQLQQMQKDADALAEDNETGAKQLADQIAVYETALHAAQQPADAQNDEIDMDSVNHVCNELDNSYSDSDDFLNAFSRTALVSGTERLRVGKYKLRAETLKQHLTKTKEGLDKLLLKFNAINNEQARNQAALVQDRLAKTREEMAKLQKTSDELEQCSAPQTEVGYWANKEIESDQDEYVMPDEVQAKMLAYFGRPKDGAQMGNFEIGTRDNKAFPGRPLYVSKIHQDKPIRLIPGTITNDKQNTSRYMMLHYHEEQTQRFVARVQMQEMPKNIERLQENGSVFGRKTTIPGKELLIFAHDVIENYRMANKFYPGEKFHFKMGKMPQDLIDAIVLYCAHMQYACEITPVQTKPVTKEELNFFQRLIDEKKIELGLNRISVSNPKVVEQTFEQTELPKRPRVAAP